MNRYFPGIYAKFTPDDVCKQTGKRWKVTDAAKQFLWQEYGESYKKCLKHLKQGAKTKEEVFEGFKGDDEGQKGKNVESGEYIVQLLICSSCSDQMCLMFKIIHSAYQQFDVDVLNTAHYPLDRGDGTIWRYKDPNHKLKYCRWNVTQEADPLPRQGTSSAC